MNREDLIERISAEVEITKKGTQIQTGQEVKGNRKVNLRR